jgi:diphosphomevalonate decarboxylase
MSTSYHAAWSAPSNIAFIKYWGKYAGQIPANASLSMSLDACTTHAEVIAERMPFKDFPDIHFTFDGKEKPDFLPKIETFIRAILPEMPWLIECRLRISSSNTFPHSSGIASSASAFAALALCLTDIEAQWTETPNSGRFFRTASHRARLGSGSAARSVYGGYTVWGKHPVVAGSSNAFAVPLDDPMDARFAKLSDHILLIDRGQKSVSSTAGHALMNDHPYAQARFYRAADNLHSMITALRSGDEPHFFDLLEEEALGLHALMMSSQPNYILMRPNTLAAIERIRHARNVDHIPVGFTLDAGANVHVISPLEDKQKVDDFVKSELKSLCANDMYICDQMGTGPKSTT